MAATSSSSVLMRLSNRVLPRMPDFYGMILDQCQATVQVASHLKDYVQTGNPARVAEIAQLEQDAEEIRERNLHALKVAFATPLDREDLYRAFTTVDSIIPLASQIIRDMDELRIEADSHVIFMVLQWHLAAQSLQAGYQKLTSTHPDNADRDAKAIFKARQAMDRNFREGTRQLFQREDLIQALQDHAPDAEIRAMSHIMDIFKRRELYRLLHDGGNILGHAGKVMHDIVVQIF